MSREGLVGHRKLTDDEGMVEKGLLGDVGMMDNGPMWTERAEQYDVEVTNELMTDVGVSDAYKRRRVLDGSM